jgi:hypothetical protein
MEKRNYVGMMEKIKNAGIYDAFLFFFDLMMVRSWNSGCWLVCWVIDGRFSSDGE